VRVRKVQKGELRDGSVWGILAPEKARGIGLPRTEIGR
jgi:hypothetical protein